MSVISSVSLKNIDEGKFLNLRGYHFRMIARLYLYKQISTVQDRELVISDNILKYT